MCKLNLPATIVKTKKYYLLVLAFFICLFSANPCLADYARLLELKSDSCPVVAYKVSGTKMIQIIGTFSGPFVPGSEKLKGAEMVLWDYCCVKGEGEIVFCSKLSPLINIQFPGNKYYNLFFGSSRSLKARVVSTNSPRAKNLRRVYKNRFEKLVNPARSSAAKTRNGKHFTFDGFVNEINKRQNTLSRVVRTYKSKMRKRKPYETKTEYKKYLRVHENRKAIAINNALKDGELFSVRVLPSIIKYNPDKEKVFVRSPWLLNPSAKPTRFERISIEYPSRFFKNPTTRHSGDPSSGWLLSFSHKMVRRTAKKVNIIKNKGEILLQYRLKFIDHKWIARFEHFQWSSENQALLVYFGHWDR